MKAIVQNTYGDPGVLALRDVPRPDIGDDHVLVRVRAAGVHIGDWHVMTGLPYLLRIVGFGLRAPKARIRGIDVAGTVEGVGRNVAQFRAGDAVYGTCDGAFAEYASARADRLAPKPANLSFVQAAAVPVSAFAALQALRDAGGIQPGHNVLIVGASGGVGIFAVQIAKAFGATVTGVCSTTKVELVRSTGADDVIDYTRQDFADMGQRYELILDTAGNRELSLLRRVLTPKGTLVLIGGEEGGRWFGGNDRQLRALMLSPFVSHKLRGLVALARKQDLEVLKELIEAGKITPVIDRTFPLSEGREAVRYLEEGHARGKIVVTSAAA
jgi:NADPH:quinone reductase-like Zn-dependent oxidoreductase